jgi:hypothetical protein
MARHAAKKSSSLRVRLVAAAGLVVVAAVVAVVLAVTGGKANPPHAGDQNALHRFATTTTAKPTTTSTTTSTTTTLPAPGPGFVAGRVTAVGDSVLIDYQVPLQADIPGIDVQAAVSRQWGTGETLLTQEKASGQLGAEIIVALGTNGPITMADFDTMMAILQGASRVVFVNFHVDRPWQDPNNAVLAAGVARYHNVVIADWATLAAQHPEWFGADGTHLAINGTGAQALAALIASTLSNG